MLLVHSLVEYVHLVQPFIYFLLSCSMHVYCILIISCYMRKWHVAHFVENDLFATYKQQGYDQYPIFGSTADPAESSKGLGLATSLGQENIHKKQQCSSRATSTFSPFIRRGSTQDLVSTRRLLPVSLPYSIHSFVLNSVLIYFPPPYSVFQHTQTLCWSYPML